MTKTCNACREIKSIESFSVNKRNKTDGRQPKCKACNSKYYAERADKIKERVSNHYYDNHDEVIARRNELRKRPEAKAKKFVQDANYRIKAKDKINQYHNQWQKQNRDKVCGYHRQWYAEHYQEQRARMLANQHKRRARISSNGNNTLTREDIELLFDTIKECSYCGLNGVKLTIDHIVPISRGGANSLDNIAMACVHCNSSKGNKTLDEWFNNPSP